MGRAVKVLSLQVQYEICMQREILVKRIRFNRYRVMEGF